MNGKPLSAVNIMTRKEEKGDGNVIGISLLGH